MKRIVLILACAALTGCATLERALENEPTCSLDRSKAWAHLGFGPFGLALKFTATSAKLMCAEMITVIRVTDPKATRLLTTEQERKQ